MFNTPYITYTPPKLVTFTPFTSHKIKPDNRLSRVYYPTLTNLSKHILPRGHNPCTQICTNDKMPHVHHLLPLSQATIRTLSARHEGCSTLRTWFKDFMVKMFSYWMTLGEGTSISPTSNSSLFSFWTFWGRVFCPHFSLFLFCFSFEVGPQPLEMAKEDEEQTF